MDPRFSLFLLVMLGLLLGFSWGTSETGLCAIPIAQKAATGADATSCFEFWFNRYQTLLGTVAALSAAVVAWVAAQQNIKRLDASIKVSRRQFAAALVEHLERRMKTLFELRDIIETSERAIRTQIYQKLTDYLSEIHEKSSRSEHIHEFAPVLRDYQASFVGRAAILASTGVTLRTAYNERAMSTACRTALGNQYWRSNAMSGCDARILEELINATSNAQIDIPVDPQTVRELNTWIGNATENMDKRTYAECEKLIDEEIRIVNQTIDQTFASLERAIDS